MERLPDRPDFYIEQSTATSKQKKGDNKKDKLSTYGILILLIVLIFIVMQKTEVSLNEITITDCSANQTNTAIFVAGTLSSGDKFADSQVDFQEKSGIATIKLYKYTTPTFFGNENFVAMIDTSDSELKEIWLQCGSDKLQIM